MDKYLIIKIKDVNDEDIISASVDINGKNNYEISAFGKRLPKKEDFVSFYNSDNDDIKALEKISFLEGIK